MPSESDELQMESVNVKQKTAPVVEQLPATNGTAKPDQNSEQGKRLAERPEEKELSAKQKKELAKAQKASRRAAVKQNQQGQPAVDLAVGNKGDLRKDSGKKGTPGPASPHPKAEHKRTGSTSAGPQPSMPHRHGPSHLAPVPVKSEKENKNVALFDHLYGNPRRTTVTGVGKDVNHSVLALGLQMRNYIVCGSSARCVAMLLAFKRVGAVHEGQYMNC